MSYLQNPSSHSLFLHAVCEQDILQLLRTLDKEKTAGYDNISPKLLIYAAMYISRPLTHIINLTFTTGLGQYPSHFDACNPKNCIRDPLTTDIFCSTSIL